MAVAKSSPASRQATRFRSRRPEVGWYTDLKNYFGSFRVSSQAPERLYEAIASNNRKLPAPISQSDLDKAIFRMPWATLVLGSGCLMIPEDAEAVEVQPALAELYERVTELDSTDPRRALGTLTREFLDALLASRESSATSRIAVALAPPAMDYLVQVLLTAALATKVYTTALERSTHVLVSADREKARFDPQAGPWAAVDHALVTPLTAAITGLLRFEDEQNDRGELATLARTIQTQLSGENLITRANVELVTAFAWYFLTEETDIYPGWSELLLLQSLEGAGLDSGQARPRDVPPRPHLGTILGLEKSRYMKRRFERVTERSWGTRNPAGNSTEREEFYDSAAALLRQQAEVHRLVASQSIDTPLPTCFVSSFDLELEMALWDGSTEPFIIAVPVLAVAELGGARDTSFHWLWTLVQPDAALTWDAQLVALRSPAEWKLLTEKSFNRIAMDGHMYPIVVHLAGAPLVNLGAAALDLFPDAESLHHALLLDEYSALNQITLETSQAHGLPRQLTDGRAGHIPRFWMFLGTQLSDTAIRLRLLTHEIAAGVRAESGTSHRAASAVQRPSDPGGLSDDGPGDVRSGVVVNERSRASELDLFHWYRLDAVQARHDALIDELTVLRQLLEARIVAKVRALKPSVGEKL